MVHTFSFAWVLQDLFYRGAWKKFFSCSYFLGFFFDEVLAQEVLVKIVETRRAEVLQDCATQLSLTTRGKKTGPKLDSFLRVDER